MSDLYDSNILTWSEQQAALLRRVGAGERANDAAIDWENIAEEVERFGQSANRACRSLIVQALAHQLRAEAWPDAVHVARWRHNAANFADDARELFTPSMRHRRDMAACYRRALKWLPPDLDGKLPLPLPAECSVTCDDLPGLD